MLPPLSTLLIYVIVQRTVRLQTNQQLLAAFTPAVDITFMPTHFVTVASVRHDILCGILLRLFNVVKYKQSMAGLLSN
jgi:hypothetical protein